MGSKCWFYLLLPDDAGVLANICWLHTESETIRNQQIRQDTSAIWEKQIKPTYRAHLFHEVHMYCKYTFNYCSYSLFLRSQGFIEYKSFCRFPQINLPFQIRTYEVVSVVDISKNFKFLNNRFYSTVVRSWLPNLKGEIIGTQHIVLMAVGQD